MTQGRKFSGLNDASKSKIVREDQVSYTDDRKPHGIVPRAPHCPRMSAATQDVHGLLAKVVLSGVVPWKTSRLTQSLPGAPALLAYFIMALALEPGLLQFTGSSLMPQKYFESQGV